MPVVLRRREASWSVIVPVVAALLVAPAVASAQTTGWRSIGPEAGAVRYLRVDPVVPTVLWAVADEGLYRSADAGASWTRLWTPTAELPDLEPVVLVDPLRPERVFLHAGERGLLRSEDGGLTWGLLDPGLEPQLLTAYPDPEPFTLLVAGSRQTLKASDNGGETWRTVTTVIDPANRNDEVDLLVPLPEPSGVLYAATEEGIYRSTDGGAAWERRVEGVFGALAVHPDEPNVVYACRELQPRQLQRSTDGGATWTSVGVGLPHSHLGALAVDPYDTERVWVATSEGLFRTLDRGERWLRVGTFAEDDWLRTLAFDPFDAETTVVGGLLDPPGVQRSVNDGRDWVTGREGIQAGDVGGFASDPFDPDVLYVGGSGVLRSSDRGVTWQLLTRRGYGPVALDPLAAGGVYAAAWSEDGAPAGVLRSTDGGASWAESGVGGSNPSLAVWALAADPTRARTAYAGAGTRLYRSTDGGATWGRLDAGPYLPTPAPIVVDPRRSGALLVPVDGVHRSTDFGATWSLSRSGITRGGSCSELTPCMVHDLALDPFDGEVVYAASECGLFASRDSGATWAPASTGLPVVTCGGPDGCTGCDGPVAVAASPLRPGMLATVTRTGLYWSRDGGASWQPLTAAGLDDPAALGYDADLELGFGFGGHVLLLNPQGKGLSALFPDEPRRPRGRLP